MTYFPLKDDSYIQNQWLSLHVFVFQFLAFKKSSGAFNHLFISVAFEITISHTAVVVKEKPQKLSLEIKVFSLQSKNRFTLENVLL